jgi:hypothetical protein
MFPMGLSKSLEFIIHEAIQVKGINVDEIFKKTEKAVITSIKIG